MEAETEAHLALAAPARKQAWVNGQSLGEETPSYLWTTPIHLKAGRNLLEWRLTAERDGELRAYWALVTEAAAFARPERMIPGDRPRKDSRLLYSLDFDVPFVPATSIFQISADSPCRLLVNGVEAGRQGGFDPYASLARVQPYTVSNLRQGANTVVVELQDIGSRDPVNAADNLQAINGHAAVTVDGLVSGAGGETQAVVSGRHWQVRRDDGDAQPVHLYRSQWLDPAWSHLRRRPHPLPEAAWLDGTPSRGVVVPVVPDAQAAEARVEWFRWVLPPDAVEMCLPLAGRARLWVDGGETPVEGETVPIPQSDRVNRSVYLRVEPLPGRTGGGVFLGPVTYRTGAGLIRLGDWGEQGLHAYSGGVRYQTTFTIDALPEGSVHLDLGRVRGTAEVWLNGHRLGARVWSPYQFDMTPAVRVGENTLEVLVLNTLAPYLEAVSPTHYVRPGQTVSGLMGPARVYLES
jgi:hypothetical protein